MMFHLIIDYLFEIELLTYQNNYLTKQEMTKPSSNWYLKRIYIWNNKWLNITQAEIWALCSENFIYLAYCLGEMCYIT